MRPSALAALAVAALAAPTQAAPNATALLARVEELTREVTALRGLPQRRPIAREAVTPAELARRIDELLEQDPAQLARDQRLLTHWGLWPADTPYRELVARTLTAQVAGYYDHRRQQLTLALDEQLQGDPLLAEAVLVHELQHALQDQTFSLASLSTTAPGEDDASAAREALIEGDGLAVMIAHAAHQLGDATLGLDSAGAGELASELFGDPGDLAELPLVLRERLLFPYAAGLVFVAHLHERGGWRAVNAAFRKPPASTEQILHPELYLAGEEPRPVQLPATLAALPGARVAEQTVWGELGLSMFLRQHGVANELAALAAAGWGGDRVSLLATPKGRELGVAQLVWDTEPDAREAFTALVRAFDHWLIGPMVEDSPTCATWISPAGRASRVELRGDALVALHDVPLGALERLSAELWQPAAAPAPQRAPKRSRRAPR